MTSHDGSSGDRLLAALGLFTIGQPEWTVEAAAAALGVSATTAYRYFASLTKAGLISPVSRASYTLGPAIIEMDRQIQISDPLLRAARGVMTGLVAEAANGSIALLCRLFHDRVVCVHQVMGRGPQAPVSYERGRPMPLFRGATSKIILAHLPPRTLKSLFAASRAEIAAAGLGESWDDFRRTLAALRRAGVSITAGDLDPGRIGIAAPILDPDGSILGSLSFVLAAACADDALIDRLTTMTAAGARAIEKDMQEGSTAVHASAARVKVAR